ncbi:MAG: hypothetical protein WBI29_02250 [Candidatus Saccharimonadales bacterium]
MKKLWAVFATIALAIIVPAALLAWGPDRPTYTIENPADHVTFNSITNNPAIGDERNFMQVREANANNNTYADQINLTVGHEYVVFMYYHNNASSSLNASGKGVANGAYVRAEIPAVVANGGSATQAVGYVGATNANPTQVWDDIAFTNSTSGDIVLRYVPGSATIHSHGNVNGATLSDNIITTGTAIGYDSLNGVLPGCEEYAGYVTFRIQADQPNFTVSKQVRLNGTKDWKKTESVDPGDSVDFLVTYQNNGTTRQNDVVVSDTLPNGMTYIADSTYIVNSTNPDGLRVSNNIVTKGGINIGDYNAGATAYVKFSAKVAVNDSLPRCGANNLNNVATVRTNNGSKTDNAIVTVDRICEDNKNDDTPEELPQTGVSEDIASLFGLGALVTSLNYYRLSRKANKR